MTFEEAEYSDQRHDATVSLRVRIFLWFYFLTQISEKEKRIVKEKLLFILGLPCEYTEQDVENLVKKYGNPRKIVLSTSKSYMGIMKLLSTAYVTFFTEEDTARALYYLGGKSPTGAYKINDVFYCLLLLKKL